MFGKTNAALERIAVALERIAVALEQSSTFLAAQTQNDEAGPGVTAVAPVTLDTMLRDSAGANPAPPPAAPQAADALREFLAARGIAIKTIPPEDPADQVINSLSLYLGERYHSLKLILLAIKRNMQQGGYFSENIKQYTQQSVSDATQFCTLLYDMAFLEEYRYFRSPQYLIKAKTTTLPKAQNFFSGQWLERFVLQKVQSAISQLVRERGVELDFAYLLNPQIILPNGDDFEMDMLFCVNNSFFWIEAKSGDYQQHIAKYAKMSGILNLDRRHAIMVLTDITPDKSAALSSLFGMTVYALHQMEEGIAATLRAELARTEIKEVDGRYAGIK